MSVIYFIVIILLTILVFGMEQRTMPTNIGMSHGLKMKEMEKNMRFRFRFELGTLANFNPSLNFPLLSFFIFISISHSKFAVRIRVWSYAFITRLHFVSEICFPESIFHMWKCQQCDTCGPQIEMKKKKQTQTKWKTDNRRGVTTTIWLLQFKGAKKKKMIARKPKKNCKKRIETNRNRTL